MRRLQPKLLALGTLFTVALPAQAQTKEPPAKVTQGDAAALVIPAGQDAVVASLITPDAAWPVGVTLVQAQVHPDHIEARYQVASGPCAVAVVASHPTAAVGEGSAEPFAKTEQFALRWRSLTPETDCGQGPRDAVGQALLKQIQSHQAEFHWVAAGQGARQGAPLPGQATPAQAGGNPDAGQDPGQQAAHGLDDAVNAARVHDDARALALVDKAVTAAESLPPEARVWILASAAAILNAVKPAQARAYAQKILQQPTAPGVEGRLARARAQQVLGNTAEVVKELESLHTQADLRAKACTMVGHVARDLELAGKASEGLQMLRDWHKAEPDCIDVVIAASQMGRRAGIAPTTLDMLEDATKRHPKDVPLTIHLAHTYKEIKRYREALALLDGMDFHGVELDKALVLDITRVYLDAPDSGASLAVHRARSDKDPTDATSAFIVGTILHHNDQWAESNRYLERSQNAFATEPRQYIYTGMNYFRMGNQAEGERLIEHAMKLGSSDPDIYYCRAVVWTLKDPKRAAADLETYLKMTAGSRETYAPKEIKVQAMLADLRACVDAKDVAACLKTEGQLRKVRGWAPWGAAGLALLGVGVWLWRRRRATAAAALLGLLALSAPAREAVAQSPTSATMESHDSAGASASWVASGRARGDLRPTLTTPTSLAAQATWWSDLDRTQLGLAAVLLVVAGGFFFASPASPLPSWLA